MSKFQLIIQPESGEPTRPFIGDFVNTDSGWEFHEDPATTDDTPLIMKADHIFEGQA